MGNAKSSPPSFARAARLARLARLALGALVVAHALAGCGRCSSALDRDGGPTDTSDTNESPRSPLPELLPPPKPLTFAKLRGITGVALPSQCSLRSPIVEATLPASTRFVAEPRSLGVLIIADAEGEPPTLQGVAALTLSPDGPTRDPAPIPWLEATALPHFARTAAGAWLAAIERPTGNSAARVDLWRGETVDPMGEGDRYEAADLACGAQKCALLTSRLGKVAGAGAEVWVGDATERASSWKRIELGPSAPESDAHPIAIAAVEPSVVAALMEKGSCVVRIADPAGPREIARLPAPHGVLDVIAAPDPIAMTLATPVDENGCAVLEPQHESEPPAGEGDEDDDGDPKEAKDHAPSQAKTAEPGAAEPGAAERAPAAVLGAGTAGARIERQGLAPIELRTAAPPIAGALRKLERGALALWIAPLGCQVQRRVVYAAVVDSKGTPTTDVVPVTDADRFAVASSGSSVDLWLERKGALTWVPMTCAAPPDPPAPPREPAP